MTLGFPSSRRPGTGGVENAGGTGTTVGFGTVAAAAAFAFTLHIAAKLRSPLGLSHYKSAVGEDGTVSDLETLLQRVAEKGLEPDARPEVWPLLLGVYSGGETYEHRSASYKGLREAFEGLLRRCQELEAACLEATSSSRRSARASSSCCGPALQSPSNTTSASASPLYFTKSPAIAGGALGTSSGGGAAAGIAAGDSRFCTELLRPVPTTMQIQMSSMDDGGWSKVVVAEMDDAAAASAVMDGKWEEEGIGGCNGATAAAALTPASEASFLGHVSRTDVPLELRPYWEAQQSIALDAVRVDFKKLQLPGATPLAAAATSNGSGGVSGLTVSLRGLGFTGLGSGSDSTPAANPAASGLLPAAAAPTPNRRSNGSGDGTTDPAPAVVTVNPCAVSGGGGGGSRITSWFREKVEEYQASRAARQQQQQQQQQERQEQKEQEQREQQEQEQQEQEQQEQEQQEISDVSGTKSPQIAAAPPAAAAKLVSSMEMQEAASLRLSDVSGLPGQLQHGQGGSEQPVSEMVDGFVEALWGNPLELGPGNSSSNSWNDCNVLSSVQSNVAAAVAATVETSSSAIETQTPPPALCDVSNSYDLGSSAATAPASDGENECAHRDGGGPGPVIIDDGSDDTHLGRPVCDMSTETPHPVAPGVCAAVPDASIGVAAARTDPRVGSSIFASRWAAFSNRMRQPASVLTLTSPRLTAALSSSSSSSSPSCPSSPLLQNDSPAGHGSGGVAAGQHCDFCVPTPSSLPSVTSTPRHASEGGTSRGFAAMHAAAAATGGAGAVGCCCGTGGDGYSSSAAAAASGGWPYVSALARFHLDHVTHFTDGQMRVVERLVMLLSAYAVHDPALGYCQGMSDLALPFVLLLEDDVMAFWCFVRFMGKVRANFLPRSDGVFERLATLGSLLAALDPQLGAHLAALHADHCHFAHRMVAAQMRRELSAELAVRLWEQLWADDLLEALMQQRLVRCNPTDQTRVAEPGAGGLSESGSCTSKVWRIGVTSFRQALCLEGLGKREEGNAEVGDLDLAVPRLEGAGSRVFERGSCTAVESDDVADFARDVSGGPFGSGGVAAASAALQGSSESLDGLEPGVMTAAAPAGEFDVLASPAEDACASAGMPWTTVDPNGSAAEAALAPSPQVSVAEVTTHGSLQGRAAAASYSEGFANCPPRAAAAGEGVSAAGLTSALSCDGAEMGDGSGIAAPAEAVAVVAVCSADDVATGGGEGPQPPACCSANPGAEGNDPQANGAPPSAIIDLAIRTAAASEDPTGSVVASAAAVTGAEPHGVAPICGGGDAAAAAAAAASAAATTNPPQPQPAFGRELFLYLVASLVLSHRRKMLECEELDDVLRLFQTLSPINRSDVNDALRRAREFREKVAQRLPPPPLAASAAGKSTAICVSTPPPTLAAALAPSAAEAPPPPPPSSSERTWRGLMSFRSDSLKAKL